MSKMKKFEAVSGDQGLFELVGASDDDTYIIRFKEGKTIGSYHSIIDWSGVEVIAERKTIKKYIPKVGDLFHEVGSASVFLCTNVKDSLEVIGLATGFHMLMEKDGSYLRAGIMDNFNVTFLRHDIVSVFGNDYIS